jgi:transcription elongation factor GreB
VEAKGYISLEGHRRLAAELTRLRTVERPKIVDEVAFAAAQGDRSENAEYIYGKKRLREIDRRTRWLEKRLEGLEPVEVDLPRQEGRCFFGAWVHVEDEDGKAATYRIMGEDEIDSARGYISYRSPLGRVLLGKRAGDVCEVQTPSGPREVALVGVRYGAPPP